MTQVKAHKIGHSKTRTRQYLVKIYPWTYHVTALAYGLDYALVCCLLAVVVFQHCNLSSD